jgi:hypothetical protein
MHVMQTNIVVLHGSVFKNFKTKCSRRNSLNSPFHERGDIFITKYITLFSFQLLLPTDRMCAALEDVFLKLVV